MTARLLLLSVALVANVSVLVICAAETSSASACSSANATSEGSAYSSSRASSHSRSRAYSKKCRRAGVCPKHERYSGCIQGECRILDCNQKGQPVLCPRIDPDYCIRGCVCQEDYLRNENGFCVPESECETQITCGENEILVNCSATCTSDYCPKSADEEQICIQSDPCRQECKCRFNYRRDVNGNCIPTTSCPPFDCSDRINEEYNPCPPLCPTDDCSLARVKGQCPYRIGIVLQCNPKCQCKEGHGRVDGICLPYDQCPNLCRSNEEYSTCIQASCRPQNCSDRDNIPFCPEVDEASCEGGCVCQKGYCRNEKGDCVSYDECGVCGPHEEIRCVQSCPPEKTCRNRDIQYSCLQVVEPCENKCVCKEGYVRNAVGDCITIAQCAPNCPGKNEVFSDCKKSCPPDTCVSLVAKYKCNSTEICKPGCTCKSGYLRQEENSPCIPICKCSQMKNSPDCNN